MRRIILRLLVAAILAAIPAVLGTVAALVSTGAGNLALGRLVGSELSRTFRGEFSVAQVGGTFFNGVELEEIVINDTLGQPFAEVERLRVGYLLPDLVRGQFSFQGVELVRPRIRLNRRTGGRWNYQEIFRLGESRGGGGQPPLVLLRGVSIRGGQIELRLPWAPPDTLWTPAARDSAIAAERARPGRVILATDDGLRRVIQLDSLNARVSRVLISSPQREPLTFDIDSLETRVSDPALSITDLAAHAWQRGDSLGFSLHRGALPDTRASGEGFVTWPNGPLRYDFTLTSPRVNLVDLRWISPDFPAMIGAGNVRAESRGDDVAAYALTDLRLTGASGQVQGDVTVLLDRRRGLGVERMSLELSGLDLDVPRPYLDTLPLRGTLTGRVSGDGFLDGLDLNADVRYLDRDIPGADTRLRMAGHVILGGTNGAVFDTMVVDTADVDLRTVRRLAPAVGLLGRLGLNGVLAGPWRDVVFTGDVAHQDGDHPESRATGTVALDTRASTPAFDAQLALTTLAFDGVRPSYPGIPVQGSVRGQVELAGTPDSFFTSFDVSGELGQVTLRGTLGVRPGGLRADELTAGFRRLDLSRLTGRGPATVLGGALAIDGVHDSVTGPVGTLRLDLGPGRVREVDFDTLHLEARGTGPTVTVDTLLLGWLAGRLGASGSVAWREATESGIHGTFLADSLTHFDALLSTYAGEPADSIEQNEPLRGRLTGEMNLLGSLRQPRLLTWARGEGLRWRGVRARQLSAVFGWNRVARPEMGGAIQSDSLVVGTWAVRDVNLVAGGYQDSLRWSGGGTAGAGASLSAAGGWWGTADSSLLLVDSLVTLLPGRPWRLLHPVTVGMGTGRIALSPVTVDATDGSGSITVSGTVPGREPGDLAVRVAGLGMRDVYALLQLDTTGLAGSIQADVAIGGTAEQPTLRGTGSLADLSFGDYGSPFIQGVLDYADRRLDANLLMWKTGQPVLRVEAQLPLDLALKSVPKRMVDGPLSVRLVADSTDLAVMEAFTRNLRRVRGTVRADVTIAGGWENPAFGGEIQVWDAFATVPGLGVRYEDVQASATLAGDSIRIDSLVGRSGPGSLRVNGVVRLEQLTRPVLDLALRARRFRFIDDRQFLTLDASGTLTLSGPLARPRLSGQVTADEGDLHFADLITKRIVDLENPGDSGLIDLDLVRTERLGANFQNRFLDSLSIDGLRIQMGGGFWLRSSEANIQLDGSLTVAKAGPRYRYDGTLNAVRGNYALRIGGLVTREFTVTRGTVRYFGTPDLNAELDIEASHTVIAAEDSEEIPIVARITGTMLQPRLELSSEPTSNRPALSQTELVSYLMFGRPTFSLQGSSGQGSQYAAVQAGLSYLTSAFSSEIQRTLITDLGVPIDFIDIRTGSGGSAGVSGESGSAQLAQVAAGWRIGRRWFVTLVADLCTNTQRFFPKAEFRMTRELRLKTSVEPAYSCQVALNEPTLSVNKYQVGLDLLWEREY